MSRWKCCFSSGPNAPAAGRQCAHCRSRPCYQEANGRVHPYCGRACARAAEGPRRTVPLDQRNLHEQLPHEIRFYEKDADFYEFTNFWPCDTLVIAGQQWLTTEHYFQAMKFAAFPDLVEQCRNLATARECFQMARDPRYAEFVRNDWHRGYPNPQDISIKDQVMHNAVLQKFTQDEKLKHLLLSTATGGVPRVLIEHTGNDSYWGDGGVRDWRVGQPGNELGQLLMRIRDELLARGTVSQFPLPYPVG